MKKFNILILIFVVFHFWGCDDRILDKEDLSAINPDDVWQNETIAQAYLNDIYGSLMPAQAFNGSATDEAINQNGVMNDIQRGLATINSVDYWPYGTINKINFFLENVEASNLSDQFKEETTGQALFWRAWVYFGMFKAYGGVPLILQSQSLDDYESLFVKRAKTSEVYAQLIQDLDDAIGMLPDQFAGADYGKIDKGVAMAFKGIVTLYYASPQFSPSGNADRWQTAYNANKAAVDFLRSVGKGLYEGEFKNIWYEERNKEVVMVNQFYFPDHTWFLGHVRPIFITRDNWASNLPSLSLVNAFPLKDGSPFDPGLPNAYDTLFKYRDDRFYATIAFNGSVYPAADFNPGEKLWTGMMPDEIISLERIIHNNGADFGNSGFYSIKWVDPDLDQQTLYDADVDWIPIRFAEVLMNYGEAANEVGNTDEALQVLYDIRERAGILPGEDGRFGVTASTKDEIREAYINERMAEFAFENKRWDDLRRWRRFDILNDKVNRKTVRFILKEGAEVPDITDDIFLEENWSKFRTKIYDMDVHTFDLKDNYYFWAIPKYHLERNSNLEQTMGWDNGTFDPLQ